ncbi:NAD(P) transhydrogenase subunit alpha [Alteromonas sp. a30]|uniref:NAD(P) transhydrogenase subunit alpha n=1 Tax=Alteromonas sp. a30 TaxID=2730917 RepID=UPI00227E4ADE|nr:NAD(P) transhydrogenase subunit alpha [Alteromonas sp. a30]MCY7296059.1 NAD(P) transhydrogenase subunit alpha [Alteromonas sp. a30]
MSTILVINESPGITLDNVGVATEKRCAATPATVKKMKLANAKVLVESGAGKLAGYLDAEYEQAGAELVSDRKAAIEVADIILYVTRPSEADIALLRAGKLVVGHLDPFFEKSLIEKLVAKSVGLISMEMIPRTTRSQKMDALSSQSNLAGYVMVMNAVHQLSTILPMMMTPSGTIKPAKVFIIGAGVAGLQAIATAKRLGASVLAFDTREVVAEQVESLGAKFLKIDLGETGQTKDGYANALSPEQVEKQKAGQKQAIADADIVITTAKLFGRKPPVIVTKDMVEAMKPGSVVVDMAAEMGGNVEGSVPGEVSQINGVHIVGTGNWENQVAKDATAMYSNNVFNLLDEYWDTEKGEIAIDFDDDILTSCVIAYDGQLRNEMLINHYQTLQGE